MREGRCQGEAGMNLYLDAAPLRGYDGGITSKGLIIMTRTTIITAQGMRLRAEGATKRTLRRAGMGALIIGALIFVSAAIIGLANPATHSPVNRPTAQEFAILHNAEKGGAKNCRLEWNEAQNGHEVICDGESGNAIPLAALRRLAARPAISKGAIADPNGIALMGECLSDSTLSNAELIACLTQPAN